MLIAFGHKRRMGKDTAANFCVSHLRATTKRKLIIKSAFADKMKEVCYDLYKWAGLRDGKFYEDNPVLKEQVIAQIGKSPRDIYIQMGTSVGRVIYIDTWLEYVLNLECDYNIISDVRFENEARAILDRGGKVYRIDNPREKIHNDVADTALDFFRDWTGVIVNDGTMQEFHTKVLKEVFNV